jgi:hypothetical protein
MGDKAKTAVVPTSNMSDRHYLMHISKRHIRIMMSREEHDDNHQDNPKDYNHVHDKN